MQAQRDSSDKDRSRVLHPVSHAFAANADSRQYDGASAIHVRRIPSHSSVGLPRAECYEQLDDVVLAV